MNLTRLPYGIYYTIKALIVVCLFSLSTQQHTQASETGHLLLSVELPNAIVYVDGEKAGMSDLNGLIPLQLSQGYHRLFIERPIKNSVYALLATRDVQILPGKSLIFEVNLKRGLSPAWKHHFKNIIETNLSSKERNIDYEFIQAQLIMQAIPAGQFLMGDDDVMFARPAHQVTIKPFNMSKYEVTFALYDRFVQQTGYDIPEDDWGRGNQPVTGVSWYDAKLFIKWLNSVLKPEKLYRLPTEAEWEYAARGGTTTDYWWGTHHGTYLANCSDCFVSWSEGTMPVGYFSPNPYGLHDTSGNVYEWVEDCWNSQYEPILGDQRARLTGYCKYRVIRGGCWFFNHKELMSASRTWNTPTKRDSTVGIRLAQDG